jgi:predicted HTH domain antitoxin
LPGKERKAMNNLNIRLLLALKLYETGMLSTGLAARLAGLPRVTFFTLLGQHGLSAFGEELEELERDLTHARQATSRHQ